MHSSSSGRWSLRTVLMACAFAAAFALLQVSYRWLDDVARGNIEPVGTRMVEEFSSVYGVLLLLPLVIWWTRRLRDSGLSIPVQVLTHVPLLVLFSLAHTTWNFIVRPILSRLVGIGAYDYGSMPARYAMEFSIHVMLYGIIVAAIVLLDARQSAREREQRLARVEAELADARLRALESRLQPHFLFNALNTISSVMYTDLAAADTMLARLADLLRRTLRADAAEVPITEELGTVELWLDVMRARFADRLQVSMQLDDDVLSTTSAPLVPPLLLQPLLENAIKHGAPETDRPANILVRARRVESMLELEVQDDGAGLRVSPEQALTRGVGLSTTRQRLVSMYGDRASMHLEPVPSGGLRVRIVLPWRTNGAPHV